MVEYDSEGKVDFIEIPEVLKETFNCLLLGIDVFNTKAEDLVKKIDKIADYDRNQSDGYTYFFPSLGLSLWRSDIFKEEYMLEDSFKKLSPKNQEDKIRHLYFDSMSIRR
ncbi:hypothetical protein M4D70_26040 [Brevibacillus borstelensis]|uniref:hypothetical protein n=1 Tax=Brevibacillus borstelensis TaxID=45462 RepID=UPI00203F5DA0|nr:hypothetical protein [Brevibacillus borstelensis]MCM3625631.1 hypothetical protein [Brevibacillus borstelensis]